jgi:hypothetical protein
MAGRYNFNISGRPDASIVNQGHITATSGGFAALVAPGVRNTGTITATLGTVSLASGNMFTLDLYGDKLIQLGVGDEIASQVRDVSTGQPLKSLVSNEGKIRANGGRVELTAAAARTVVDSVINNKGVIEANSIGTHNGMIVLGAATSGSKSAGAPKQTVRIAGKLSAAGRKKGTSGGTIVVTGENIEVANAKINASGESGGGKVLIGGDWAGGNPALGLVNNQSAKLEGYAIATATTLSVDSATTINASATGSGNGGKVILWSDALTTFAGTIFAQGGALGGNGGFVETSGHNQLAFTGNVDTRAPNGAAGTLLLDPRNVEISSTADQNTPLSGNTFTPNDTPSNLNVTTLHNALQNGNVVVTTGGANSPGTDAGDIEFQVATNLAWSADTTLTLSAFRSITLLQGSQITNTGAGNLILRADNSGMGTGAVNLGGGFGSVDYRGSTGTVSIYYDPLTPVTFGGNKYQNQVIYTGSVSTNPSVPGQLNTYMLVNNTTDLGFISTDGDTLNHNYALGKSFDAGSLGTSIGAFTGVFDGNGGLGVNSSISNLSVGLFSTIGNTNHAGTVRNLNLASVAINATGGGNVGALAATNNGSIINVGVTGSVTSSSGLVGSLVAVNETGATIASSFSAGTVAATTGSAGGLVGSNGGSITNSYSMAAVSGGAGTTLGGLVGVLGGGTITNSYAAGRVSGGNPGSTGGLVGSTNAGSVISSSFWDSQTSGLATSAGSPNSAGLTTAALQSALQSGWDSNVWGIVPGVSYPFLNWQFPSGTPQVVSGIAYSDHAVTPAAGVAVNGLLSGSPLASVLGPVTSGANGYYYYLLAPGTISAPATQLLTYTSGASGGATFQHNASGSAANLNIFGTYLALTSGASTYSSVLAGLAIADSGNSSVQTFVNTLANRDVVSTGASFVIDQSINVAGQLGLATAGSMTQTTPITGTTLVAVGPGTFTLANPTNHFNALGGNLGSLNYSNNANLSLIGVTANTLQLGVSGIVTQSAALNVTNLSLGNIGSGATYTLTNTGNQVGTLAAVANGVTLVDAANLSIGTVNNVGVPGSVTGISTGTLTLSDTGTVSQSAPITATNLALLGTGGSYTLNANNHVNVLAANTGSVSFTDGQALTIGTVGSTVGLTAGTAVLSDTGAVGQTAAINASNLTLLGAGGSYTLTNSTNHVGTLAANTGAVSFMDAQNLNIATIGSTSGVTTSGAFTLNVNGTISAPAPVNVGTTFTLAGGNWVQNAAALAAFSASDFRIAGGTFLRATGGSGTAGSPYSIADVYGLQGIGSLSLGNSYVLANDINAAGTSGWNAGSGFKTIGTTFNGTFNGQNHAIDHLLIASSQSPTGMFGFIGSGASVSNLKLTNINVTGTHDLMFLGGLAGENDGTVNNVSVSGTVNGGTHTGIIAGGLVGQNRGTITGSSSAAVVSVGSTISNNSINIAGSLVGSNQGSVSQSSASGNVTGGARTFVGGLVGQNGLSGPGGGPGTVSASAATGNVAGGTNSSIGGLVGFNSMNSTVTGSHASGNVALTGSGGWGGGLVGQNNGQIALSFYENGTVSGNGNASQFAIIGGLAGQNQGTINDSHATANVTGTQVTAGGLVGYSIGTITGTNAGQTFANATISIGGDGSAGGGLVGASDTGGSIHNANATGSVVRLAGAPASDLLILGGLVGRNDGSIDHSIAAVTVNGGFSSSGGLVGQNSGSIMFSSASGNVSGFGTPLSGSATIGGLVGNNLSGASIDNSSASGNVTGGDGTTAGGLVGFNSFGNTITASHATGNVSIDNPGLNGGSAGGLVGDNQGSIANSDATGAVSGGQETAVGGLVGNNSGSVADSHATGNVTGTNAFAIGGLIGSNEDGASVSNSFATGNVTGNNTLANGGLVGTNDGTISQSQASGAVTGSGAVVLTGGLVGENSGTITDSSASGAVSGGLAAGGLVGFNEGTITSSVATGAVGSNIEDPDTFIGGLGGLVGLNAFGTITNSHAEGVVTGGDGSVAGGLIGSNFGGAVTDSHATGNVSGGASSFVGGLVGFNISDLTGTGQSFTGSHATGNVSGGGNSIVGGFFGANLFGTINNAFATGTASGGAGSTVGGFGGLNIGTIDTAFSSGAASGGTNSFVGGFLGVNFAAVDPGIPFASGVVTRSYALGATTGGADSFVAGFAAINVGSLDQTYAGGLVTGGAGSTTGGLVASNSYNYMLPAGIALLDPPGTATNSFWDRQTTGQNTSAGGNPVDTAQLAPGLPGGFDPAVWGTSPGQYPFLIALGPSDTTPGTPVQAPQQPQQPQEPQQPQQPDQTPVVDVSPVQQVIQDLRPQASLTSLTTGEVVNTQAVTGPIEQQQQQGQQTGGGAGAANQTPQAPQPIRLNVGEGRYFYLPPVGETRLVTNEVVLQLPCNPGAAFDNATRQLRLTVINSQCMGQTAVYRVQISSGQTINSTIRALAAYRLVAAAQANYTYALAQDAEAETQGDSGQYILDKLKLADIHRVVKGTNVPIGVIDSEIDVSHPDLEGIIAERYDATGDEDKPHPHGTGMAGAIGSHHRLMGIAPSARLYAIRAFSGKASSAESTTFNILKGLDWAVSHEVRIVNMSFAGPKDPSLERALKAAHDKGIVLVAAAGNAGPKSPPLYPAADPSVIAVTATDIDDKLFSGANRGRYVAIAAPGVDILVPAPEGTYQMTTGTSVATAHISGIVALLLERNPRLKPDEIRKILAASAKRLGPNNEFGAGLVDPARALELAAPRSAAAPGPITR